MAGASSQLNAPYGVDVTATGDVLIADHFTHRVRRVDLDLLA